MTATKEKAWVSSMFSQHANFDNCISSERKKSNGMAKKTSAAETTEMNTYQECSSDDAEYRPPVSKKIRIASRETFSDNWLDVFAPKNSEELAVHPKKRQELQRWFQHSVLMKQKNSVQLCLLTGPSGSGKTTAVRILAKESNVYIQEWINPVDQDNVYHLGDQTHTFASSQLETFKNFLFKASRYRSLLETSNANKCLLLLEDFPNFILEDPLLFQEILEEYVNYAKSPIIFIVTDAKTRGLNISYNIFTDQIKEKFNINHITFNPIAPTLMQKAIKRFCNLMRSPSHCQHYKPPQPGIVDSIVLSAQGDIRNAFINIHFSLLRGDPNVLTKQLKKEVATKTSKKKKASFQQQSLGRDESLTMMHALGRVFNPKFAECKRFLHSPEELAESFAMEPRKFIDLVEANYLAHFREIDYIVEAADGLSLCDVMLNEYRDDSMAHIGLNLAIRSMMVANVDPASGWIPIKGQKRFETNKTRSKLIPQSQNISSSLYTVEYKTFVNIIENLI